MERVERRIRRGVDATYFADVRRDYQRLVDDAYLGEKGVIMDAIDHFIGLVNRRTLGDVEQVRSDNRNLFVAQIAILGLIVLAGVAAMVLLRRVALRPLGQLIGATRRIAAGDYARAGRHPRGVRARARGGRVQRDGRRGRVRRRRARAGRARRRRGAPHGRARQPRQVDVPGRHEPRDPHADDRRHRDARGARPDRPERVAAAHGHDRPELRPIAACRSSATSWTSRRSRPGGWSSRRRRSRCGR